MTSIGQGSKTRFVHGHIIPYGGEHVNPLVVYFLPTAVQLPAREVAGLLLSLEVEGLIPSSRFPTLEGSVGFGLRDVSIGELVSVVELKGQSVSGFLHVHYYTLIRAIVKGVALFFLVYFRA